MQVTLVAAVAAALIYFIGKEVVGAFRHPSDEELVDYWNGSLQQRSRRGYRQVSEHLGACEECRDRLDKIRKDHAGPGADAPMIERKY